MDTIMATAIGAALATVLLCVMASAKRGVPITVDEAKVLWKIHKKNSDCNGHKWQPLKRKGDKIKGFQCECGYKYKQIKPIVAGVPVSSKHYKTSEEPRLSWR